MGIREQLKIWIPWGARDEADIEYISLADLPTWQELEQRSIAWPLGYRIMLNTSPLQGRDLYVERPQAEQQLQAAVERWHGGFAPMVAVVGPDGAGRTTLLNWFESGLPIGESVSRLNDMHRLRSELALIDWLSEQFMLGQPVKGIDELVVALKAQPPRIVILDDLQRLTLRTLGNSQVVHALMAIMLGTQEHFLWIVSCREYGWRMLDYQFGLSRYFTHRITMGYFRAEELREAMRLRMVAAGMLEEEGEPMALPALLSGGRQQEFMAVSSGNMRAALFHLQIYASYDEEQQQLVMRQGKKVELSTLRERGDLDLFTLGEVVVNSGLRVDEHAEIFQREPLKSRVVLEHLHQLRLLEKSELEGGESFYQLDPVFYLPVTAMLQAAHVLY